MGVKQGLGLKLKPFIVSVIAGSIKYACGKAACSMPLASMSPQIFLNVTYHLLILLHTLFCLDFRLSAQAGRKDSKIPSAVSSYLLSIRPSLKNYRFAELRDRILSIGSLVFCCYCRGKNGVGKTD